MTFARALAPLLLLAAGEVSAAAAAASSLSVELVVENRNWQDLDYLRGVRTPRNLMPSYSFARIQEPATSGIPLPAAADIRSTVQLALFTGDGKQEIPAQFRALARHHAPVEDTSAPIRVVLVDFQADVPAGGEARYLLKASASSAGAGPPLAAENEAAITVTTGPLQFKIHRGKGFSTFDEVRLRTAQGERMPVVAGSAGGLQIVHQGRLYSSRLADAEAVVEENGPLRAMVRVRGAFREVGRSSGSVERPLTPPKGRNPLTYTARLTAFRGKSYVKVSVRLENENMGWSQGDSDPPRFIYLDSFEVATPLALRDAREVVTQGWRGSAHEVVFAQRWDNRDPTDETKNFSFRTVGDGREAGVEGGRADGWITLGDGENRVTVVRRFFWQEHPATLGVTGNTVRVGLFPAGLCNDECRDGAFRFWGGYHKTFELLYAFQSGVGTPDDPAALQAVVKSPLFARPSPEWYVTSGVFGPLAPFGHPKGVDAPSRAALKSREGWARVKYDRTLDQNRFPRKDSLYTYRETRPFSIESRRPDPHAPWYGWERYGEMYSERYGAVSQDYGWSFFLLGSFLESGDLELLNLGLEFAGHHADIDVIHDPKGGGGDPTAFAAIGHGAQRYEMDAHNRVSAASHTGAITGTSHAWSKGEMVAYLLTGDPRFRESVEAQAEHARRAHILQGRRVTGETRQQGWGMRLMLNGYRISGRSQILDDIMRVFREGILVRERDAPPGSSGYTTQQAWALFTFLGPALGPEDLTLTTSKAERTFPARGVVKIDDEEIKYERAEGVVLRGLTRGYGGTTPASHAPRALVKLIATDAPTRQTFVPVTVPTAHLFYDFIVGMTLVEVHDALVDANRPGDAAEVREFLLRMALFLRDKVMPSFEKPLGSTDERGFYYPYSFPYVYRADMKSLPDFVRGLMATDVLAFAFRATRDPGWLNLARNFYTDALNYWVVQGWSLREPRPRQASPHVLMGPFGATWFEIYGYVLYGKYYLYTDYLHQRKAP